MPRFFFDLAENANEKVDEEGIVLPDLKAMRDEANRSLPAIAAEELPDGPQHLFRVKVRDEGGQDVFEATLELKSKWLTPDGVGKPATG